MENKKAFKNWGRVNHVVFLQEASAIKHVQLVETEDPKSSSFCWSNAGSHECAR